MPGSAHASAHEDRLAAALARALPAAVARRIAVEWTILRSAVSPAAAPIPGATAFGYAAESSMKLIVLAFPLVVLGDLLFTEAAIPARFVALRVALAVLGVYGFVWLLGIYRTMVARPHLVEGGVVHLRRGILASARVPLDAIASVERLDDGARPAGRPARLDLRGAPRLLVTTRVPVVVRGASVSRMCTRLLVSADDASAFRARLLAEASPHAPAAPRAAAAAGTTASGSEVG